MLTTIKILCGVSIALCILRITYAEKKPTISIETSLGQVKGIQKESRLGNKFWAFQGVRYAEAPVGELRFQNPQPVKAWKTEYDATKESPLCPQGAVDISNISEDCLRLNIYTKDKNERKPVIVYISHGGFYFGGTNRQYTGPEWIVI